MKIEVYTSVIGQTDALRDPSIVAPGVRYYCATDHEIESDVWAAISVTVGDVGPVRTARRFKSMLHEEAYGSDFYLWIDAAFRLDVDPEIFAPLLLRYDILVMPHPERASIQDEAEILAARDLAPRQALARQASSYQAEGYPDEKLSSTGFMVRRSDARTQHFNRLWFAQLEQYGHNRDQMCFDYMAWKQDIAVGNLEGVYTDNPFALWGRSMTYIGASKALGHVSVFDRQPHAEFI